MKASCALGTFFLGATELLHGATSAHQARSYWGPRSPHVVAAVSCNVIVDGVVLEGTVTFVRPIICDTPKVVNIKANTALVVRSLDVLSTSNLHFVVHTGSKLTFSAKGGITLDRDEDSTRPLITTSGEVSFNAGGWIASYGEGSTEHEGDVIRFVEDGTLDHPHAVRFTPNSVIAADATAEHRKDDRGAKQEFIKLRDLKKSSLKAYDGTVKTRNSEQQQTSLADTQQDLDATGPLSHPSRGQATTTPTPSISATSSNGPTPAPATTSSTAGNRGNVPTPASTTSSISGGGNGPTPTTSTSTRTSSDRGWDTRWRIRSAGLAGPGWWRRPPPPTDPADQYGDAITPSLSPTHNEAPGADTQTEGAERDHEEGRDAYVSGSQEEPPPLVTVLRVGEVLRGKLHSGRGMSAVWPDVDGSLMFRRLRATPLDGNERGEGGGGGEEGLGCMPMTILVRSNSRKLRRAMTRRKKVMEELRAAIKAAGDGQQQQQKKEEKKDAWGWLPWRRRGERLMARSRWFLGAVEMTIDDRACVRVKVDGTTVLAKSGMFQWEFLNRLPWRWPKDQGYEVHVVGNGIEVQLRGRIVWDVEVADIMF